MKEVLMVAEKPQLAQSLAKILSQGSLRSRRGMNGACSVHEYTGTFRGQQAKFKVWVGAAPGFSLQVRPVSHSDHDQIYMKSKKMCLCVEFGLIVCVHYVANCISNTFFFFGKNSLDSAQS